MKTINCPSCNGSGTHTCPECNGTGNCCDWCHDGSGRVECEDCDGGGTIDVPDSQEDLDELGIPGTIADLDPWYDDEEGPHHAEA